MAGSRPVERLAMQLAGSWPVRGNEPAAPERGEPADRDPDAPGGLGAFTR